MIDCRTRTTGFGEFFQSSQRSRHISSEILFSCINICMKKHIPYTEVFKTPDIAAGENSELERLIDGYKNELRPRRLIEQQTTSWLKDNGLNDRYLEILTEDQLRALQTCHHLLTTQLVSLTPKQRRKLKDYRRTLRNEKMRHTITQGHTYAVLNLGKKFNRQLFAQHRQQNNRQSV